MIGGGVMSQHLQCGHGLTAVENGFRENAENHFLESFNAAKTTLSWRTAENLPEFVLDIPVALLYHRSFVEEV